MKTVIHPLLILTLIAVTGCATVGRKIDQAKLDQIQTGVTTRQGVVDLIGSPDQISTDAATGNTIFMYMYARAVATPESYIPLVGAFAGGAKTQNQVVIITLGVDGKVTNVTNSYGASETGTGISSSSKADLKEVEQNKRPK